MIRLVFGLENNVCEYILIYTDSQGFFWWVCPWTAAGWGGKGGMGLEAAPWTRPRSKMCPVPEKHNRFFGALQTTEKVRKGACIVGAWLTLESSSLFFDSFLFSLFSFFFGDLPEKKIAELPHYVNYSVRTVFFLDLVRVFFTSFRGASVTLHS